MCHISSLYLQVEQVVTRKLNFCYYNTSILYEKKQSSSQCKFDVEEEQKLTRKRSKQMHYTSINELSLSMIINSGRQTSIAFS